MLRLHTLKRQREHGEQRTRETDMWDARDAMRRAAASCIAAMAPFRAATSCGVASRSCSLGGHSTSKWL
jgi:hypothetical protein